MKIKKKEPNAVQSEHYNLIISLPYNRRMSVAYLNIEKKYIIDIIIDEYDNPFIEAKVNGYYDDVRGILSDIFGNTFKGNDYIYKGVMTGIQRIAQESIFSKFNNPSICTVVEKKYSDKFGLTEEETREYLEYFGYELVGEVKQFYNGYNFGGVDVYNPMSISSYIGSEGELDSYWVNTSANTLIRKSLLSADKDFMEDFEKLIEKMHNNLIKKIVLCLEPHYNHKKSSGFSGKLKNNKIQSKIGHLPENHVNLSLLIRFYYGYLILSVSKVEL